MGQTLGDFLKITSADDYFMINVHKNKETVSYSINLSESAISDEKLVFSLFHIHTAFFTPVIAYFYEMW